MTRAILSPQERAAQRTQVDELIEKCETTLDKNNDGNPVRVDVAGFSKHVINEVIRRYKDKGYEMKHEYRPNTCDYDDNSTSTLIITPPC